MLSHRVKILSTYLILFIFPTLTISSSYAKFGDEENDGLNFMERMLSFVTKKSPEKSIPEAIREGLPKLYDKHLNYQETFGPKGDKELQAANNAIVEFLNGLNNPESGEYKINSNLSLARSLRIHGLPSLQNMSDEEIIKGGIEVRSLLRLQSKINKERLLREMNFNEAQILGLLTRDEIELIDKLQVLPFHRSCNRLVKTRFNTPLISSKQLGYLGLTGANTRYAFNREYLQSDDNIFFRADLVNMKSREVEANKTTEYGNNSISIESHFAHEYAFLSPFLMYSTELHNFARLQNKNFDKEYPDFYDYSNALESVDHPDAERAKRFYQVMDPYKNRLYLFDLTLKDYEELVRAILLKSLFILKNGGKLEIVDNHPYLGDSFTITYEALLKSLEEGSPDINHLLKIIANIPEYELKIPLALPLQFFRFF